MSGSESQQTELQQLEQIIRRTFDDYRLSRGEGDALESIVSGLENSPDQLRFLRNRAFDLVRREISGADESRIIDWLEDVVKVIDRRPNQRPRGRHAVCFSPGDACRNQIISLVETSSVSIDICVFTITDDRISSVLADAHRRGIAIRIISDDEKARDKGSDIYRLAQRGIPMATDRSPDHMHHKFAVFDNTILVNGSFNWTRSASHGNHENILVTTLGDLVQPFIVCFDSLWSELS